jgi:hypothetical protein
LARTEGAETRRPQRHCMGATAAVQSPYAGYKRRDCLLARTEGAETRRCFPRAIFHGELLCVCSNNQCMRRGLIALTRWIPTSLPTSCFILPTSCRAQRAQRARRCFPRAIFHGELLCVCSNNQCMRRGLIALTRWIPTSLPTSCFILPTSCRAQRAQRTQRRIVDWWAPMNAGHCEMYYARVEVRSGMREP